MNSIFSRLFRYRPRPDRLPEEDFFTEAFVGVLKKSDLLQSEFVKWLIGQEVHEVDLETQKTFDGGGRVDVWIDARNCRSGARHVVAVENKIGAQEGPNQLQGYAAELQVFETAESRTLVYATRHERSEAQDFLDAPDVTLLQIHWFQVADWLREWMISQSYGGDDAGTCFAGELVLLMEDWNMAMNMNIDDLAAASTYHTSVAAQFEQILNQVYEACNVPGTRGNPWTYKPLWYSSPWIDDQQNIYVKFGFDFDRSDAGWSVADLRLPSAYFAVRGENRPEIDNLTIDWQQPPDGWHPDNLRVKQLDFLQVPGDPLHLQYLAFFEGARAELWRAVGLMP